MDAVEIAGEQIGYRGYREEAHSRLDTYLTGTLPVLEAGGWRTQEACLGLYSGSDRIVAEGEGYDSESVGSGCELQLTLILGRETECMIEVLGYPQQVHRTLAPGVPAPTTDEALRIYLSAFGHPDDEGDE
ncbi:MAG: hypothetical protein M3R38_20250 [Actinomycetota bacterium]|nr:hypothetical protein [Actinomycetota bacterium]